jgi:tyrosinase
MASKKPVETAKGAASRYHRVKQLLEDAAGQSSAQYGGAAKFWNLPLDRFKAATVYGVRMIAPEPSSDLCSCSCHCAPAGVAGKDKTRSEASGLIKGLRGEAPFDGVQFPPLLWGGSRIAEADVQFIADWIDDDCPETDDRVMKIDLRSSDAETREHRIAVADIAEFKVVEGAEWLATKPGMPRQRPNLDCMSKAQLDGLRRVFRKVFDLNKNVEDRRNYNNQALLHQNHCQHGWERFLPWHRAYLYEFEQNVQDFFPMVTLPYWDWTTPEYQPKDTKNLGARIPKALQAFLTEEEAEKLVEVLSPVPTREQKQKLLALGHEGRCFTSQHAFFGHVVCEIRYKHISPKKDDFNRQRCIDALLASNALWYPLRYPAEYKTIRSLGGFGMHFPSADDMAQIVSLNNFRDFGGGSIYDAAFGFLDQNPHNTMHVWCGGENPEYEETDYWCNSEVGVARLGLDAERLAARRSSMVPVSKRNFHKRADMYGQPKFGDMLSNLTASYDPIFWPIHVNLDRVWHEWQRSNPNAMPVDRDAVLAPWNYTVGDTLDIARFGYEYVRGSYFIPVGTEASIARFVSQSIPIDDKVKGFRKAEVRLHWVPQLMRSCFIRVFLNQPGADARTSITNNPHFAGYCAIFGHGPCYGGPGHCDAPPPRPRDYDWRTRSHNTPRNHRIDVTASAQKLLELENELQITLLVIGSDYEEDTDVLKLEGVSLTLFD